MQARARTPSGSLARPAERRCSDGEESIFPGAVEDGRPIDECWPASAESAQGAAEHARHGQYRNRLWATHRTGCHGQHDGAGAAAAPRSGAADACEEAVQAEGPEGVLRCLRAKPTI